MAGEKSSSIPGVNFQFSFLPDFLPAENFSMKIFSIYTRVQTRRTMANCSMIQWPVKMAVRRARIAASASEYVFAIVGWPIATRTLKNAQKNIYIEKMGVYLPRVLYIRLLYICSISCVCYRGLSMYIYIYK